MRRVKFTDTIVSWERTQTAVYGLSYARCKLSNGNVVALSPSSLHFIAQFEAFWGKGRVAEKGFEDLLVTAVNSGTVFVWEFEVLKKDDGQLVARVRAAEMERVDRTLLEEESDK